VSGPFRELMLELSFKAYLYTTDRTSARAGGTETQKLEFMYESLLGDLLIRHRTRSELSCFIEQNDSIKRLVRDLPEKAARRAREKLGRNATLPGLSVAIVAKTEPMSIAIVDYVMMAVSRWIRSGGSTDPANRDYRFFREIEPFISVLYSLERGRISSRKVPLH
jgi:hypothetical protein